MISRSSTTVCKVCNSSDTLSLDLKNIPVSAQPFLNSPSDKFTISSPFHICDSCGHMFLDIQPVTYYKSVIRSVSVSDSMTSYRLDQFKRL